MYKVFENDTVFYIKILNLKNQPSCNNNIKQIPLKQINKKTVINTLYISPQINIY